MGISLGTSEVCCFCTKLIGDYGTILGLMRATKLKKKKKVSSFIIKKVKIFGLRINSYHSPTATLSVTFQVSCSTNKAYILELGLYFRAFLTSNSHLIFQNICKINCKGICYWLNHQGNLK